MNTKKPLISFLISLISFVVLMIFTTSDLDSSGGFFERYGNLIKSILMVVMAVTGALIILNYKKYRLNIIWFILGVLSVIFAVMFLFIGYSISNIGL